MTRPKGVINPELFVNLLTQAYRLGAREVGLYGGSEPLACRDLECHIKRCKNIGYDYVYITTNGSMADQYRLKKIVDAGLDSIKFSLNAGDRQTYKEIHGCDHFDKVCDNIEYLCRYRRDFKKKFYLAISFVGTAMNIPSFEDLKKRFSPIVDEIFYVKAYNCSGQMPELPRMVFDGYCTIPFKRAVISREGYIRVCCNDYQNFLALENLNQVSLEKAWFGKRFIQFRKNFLKGKLSGTLCNNCISGSTNKVQPLNQELSPFDMI